MALVNAFGSIALESTQQDVKTAVEGINACFKNEDSAAVSGDKGLPLLGVRSSTDAVTTDADGDYTLLKLDEEGRLKVASKPASYPDFTGDITAVQATINTPVVGGAVAGDVSRASNIMIFCTGTFSAVNCTFEGSLEASGDTNWFAVQCVRSNANTIELTTGSLSAQPAYAWEASVNALKRFRVRCTARTSGTQSWRFVQGTYATEPIPAIQTTGTQAVSLTSTTLTGSASLGHSTHHHLISAATTNATSVKASAGSIGNITLSNNGASVGYWKLYNKASAPTVGTDTPVRVILMPANSTVSIDCSATAIRLATGIAYAVTGGVANTDTTAVSANQFIVGIVYT